MGGKENIQIIVSAIKAAVTPLEGEAGMEDWIKQYKSYYFENLPARALEDVVASLHGKLHTDSGWVADYRRLRFVAVKL